MDLDCGAPFGGVAGACRPFVTEEGAECTDRTIPGPPSCAGWLRCDNHACTLPVEPFALEGERCDLDDRRCLPRLSCDAGSCKPLPAMDEYCTDYTGGGCARGLMCNGWMCQAAFTEGQPCYYQAQCGEGLGCDHETSTCVVKKESGASCTSFRGGQGECAEHLRCVRANASSPGVCSGDRELGDTCTDDVDCSPGLRCLADQCIVSTTYLGC
jgi:hypothetical protein